MKKNLDASERRLFEQIETDSKFNIANEIKKRKLQHKLRLNENGKH